MHNGGMRTHADIIRDAGIEKIAGVANAPLNTVRSWVVRDSLPAKHWQLIVQNGLATADELMRGKAV